MSDVETAVTSLGREVTRLAADLARVTGELGKVIEERDELRDAIARLAEPSDHGGRDRLARWHFDSARLGWTERNRNTVWEHDTVIRNAHTAWADALLAELGRGAG